MLGSLTVVAGAWLFLQSTLSLACTAPAGLEWLLDGGSPSLDLGSVVVFPFFAILLVGASHRLWQTHPDALCYFDSFPRCLALFSTGVVAAGVLEQAFDFHFVPSIGIYAATATLFLAAGFGGLRRPFRHLSLDQPAARWADVTAIVLMGLAYVEFCFDAQLWDYDREHLDAGHWWMLQAAFTAMYLLLAWSLLHGSPVKWLARLVRRLENAESSSRSDLGTLVHATSAAGVTLALLVIAGQWVEELWRRDAWIFPQGAGNQVFLGVDWYFVSATESLHAAELMVFCLLAVVVFSACARPST